MKTLLFVEQDRTELDRLVSKFRKWRKDIKILMAKDETVALQLMANHPVDIIICSLDLTRDEELQILCNLTEQFPHIPLIYIGDNDADVSMEVRQIGIYLYHERPINTRLLLDQVTELLETSTSGSIKGVPIHSFLQMLEGEAKTCTLQCKTRDATGYIYLVDGVLIDAECGSITKEEAVYEMIGWEEAIIQIRFFNGNRKDKIKKPLISIIMEGMRLKDEKRHKKDAAENSDKSRPSLKRFLTAGHRISLDMGARVTLEVEKIDSPLIATMVGMIPGSHLVLTTPEHFSVMGIQPEEKSGLLVKYLDMGKLCLFKSIILRSIQYPGNLLFISYPSIVHYHELRKTKRLAIFIPCTVLLSDDINFKGALVDLSNSGGLFQTLAKGGKGLPDVQIGEKLTIHCQMPGLKETQEIQGKVRNFQKNSQEAKIGLEFQKLRPFLQETINHYLDSIEQNYA